MPYRFYGCNWCVADQGDIADECNAVTMIRMKVLVVLLDDFIPVLTAYDDMEENKSSMRELETRIKTRVPNYTDEEADVLLKHAKIKLQTAIEEHAQQRTEWELGSLNRAARSKISKDRASRKYVCKKDHTIKKAADLPNPREVKRILNLEELKDDGLKASPCKGFVHCTLCDKITGQPNKDSVIKHCAGLGHKNVRKQALAHQALTAAHLEISRNGSKLTDEPIPYHKLWMGPQVPDELVSHITPSLNRQTVQFRAQLMNALLKAGVARHAVETLKGVLNRWTLPECTTSNGVHLGQDYIPELLLHQRRTLKSETDGQLVWLIFDGATRVAEVLCVIVRFLGEDNTVQQRLIRLKTYKGSFDGEELLTAITDILQEAKIKFHLVVGTMSDM
jgi:hypothetical protein